MRVLLCSLFDCNIDRNSTVNETAVIRWDYGDPSLGTCKETIEGGNHFRYWVQNGPSADRYISSRSLAIYEAHSYSVVPSLWRFPTKSLLQVRVFSHVNRIYR